MEEILADPLKRWMLIALVAVEVPAAAFLIWAWFRDKRRYGEGN